MQNLCIKLLKMRELHYEHNTATAHQMIEDAKIICETLNQYALNNEN